VISTTDAGECEQGSDSDEETHVELWIHLKQESSGLSQALLGWFLYALGIKIGLQRIRHDDKQIEVACRLLSSERS